MITVNNQPGVINQNNIQTFFLGNNLLPKGIMSILMSFLSFQNQLALYNTSRNLTNISSLITSAYPKLPIPMDFDITDEDVVFLKKFPLRILSLNNSPITNSGLQCLSSFTSLESLDLHGCRHITGDGFNSLINLHSLRFLSLENCNKAYQANFAYLSQLSSLRGLNLSKTDFDEECLNSLSTLTSLHVLDIRSCHRLTDGALTVLTHLHILQKLDISLCSNITDECLETLSKLTSLQNLQIVGCEKITRAGLKSLSALSSLQSITIDWLVGPMDMKALANLKDEEQKS